MYNTVFTDPDNALLKDRLARVQESLRLLDFPTREEYQAEVYSRVNAVLALGNSMSPLFPISAEGPAIIGDVSLNTRKLNQDAGDVAREVLRVEASAARLYNLAATSQNSLRQQIREQVLGSTTRRYLEAFLHNRNLGTSTASIDYNVGVATLPLLEELTVSPKIVVGSNSVGAATDSGVEALTDSNIETALVWNGSLLELILTFPVPTIVNRMKIDLDDYQGLEISALSTSADGTLYEDVLQDLGVDRILLNGVVGKYSGDFIIDFPPRHVQQMRLVILDRVDVARIALRSLELFQRRYGPSAVVKSLPINNPAGTVKFTTIQHTDTPLTSVTHQISYNGVHFTAITPGDKITLSSKPFWYKAILERSPTQFALGQSPLVNGGLDPKSSDNYVLRSMSSVPLGNTLLERTIILDQVTGPIHFRETPLPGTLQIQEGAVIVSPDEYAFADNVLSFATSKTAITLSYQTTALGSAALKERENYYSPLLFEFRFEAVI